MSQSTSIEYINGLNGTQSVSVTNAFIRHCGSNVFQVMKREEIPLLAMRFWNIKISEQLENNCFTFDNLPGKQLL